MRHGHLISVNFFSSLKQKKTRTSVCFSETGFYVFCRFSRLSLRSQSSAVQVLYPKSLIDFQWLFLGDSLWTKWPLAHLKPPDFQFCSNYYLVGRGREVDILKSEKQKIKVEEANHKRAHCSDLYRTLRRFKLFFVNILSVV